VGVVDHGFLLKLGFFIVFFSASILHVSKNFCWAELNILHTTIRVIARFYQLVTKGA
jgi:hypothetical protein